MRILQYLVILFGFIVLLPSCKENKETQPVEETEKKPRIKIPSTNKDSIFQFVVDQLSFGHRVPGMDSHVACKDWLVSKLESYGAKVEVQHFKTGFLTVSDADAYNIIASYNPDASKRVLLSAHWDSRLIAEKDPDVSKQYLPIMGADDGGSGVAALLEIARQLQLNPIDLGVDIVLFDAEDQGISGQPGQDRTWCLGSQFWTQAPHIKNYKADFGIHLDLIGAKGASFGYEGYSTQFAGDLQQKIWALAHRMGGKHIFHDTNIGRITDDHYYVNTNLNIPQVNIINYDVAHNGFGKYHHTHKDDIDIIDKNILRRVTQLTIAVLYKTEDGSF